MPKTERKTLTQLLDEWAELEPTKCEADTYDDPDGLGYFLLPQMKGNQSWVPKPVSSGWNRGEVQTAVQEAVEGRGWGWNVYGDGFECGADVIVDPDTEYRHRWSDTPAHALLSAYLKAIRAHD